MSTRDFDDRGAQLQLPGCGIRGRCRGSGDQLRLGRRHRPDGGERLRLRPAVLRARVSRRHPRRSRVALGSSRRALRLRHPGLPRHGRGDARRREDGEPRGDPDGDRGRRLGRRLGGEGSGPRPGRHRRGRLLDRLRRGADARLDRGRQGEGRLCHRLRRRHVRARPRDRARKHRLGHDADLRSD